MLATGAGPWVRGVCECVVPTAGETRVARPHMYHQLGWDPRCRGLTCPDTSNWGRSGDPGASYLVEYHV